jgi:tetratricopeptide (TPR) repeat protein
MRPETARALQNLGFAYLQLGQIEESLQALDKASRIFEREKNETWSALTDLYRALSLHTAKSDEKALALAESARQRLTGSPLRSKEILASILVARLHLLRGNLTQAKQIVQGAQVLLGATKIPHLQLNADLLQAETAHACGELQAAKDSYEKAHLLAEGLRRRLARDEIQLSFLEDKGSLYRGLVELLLQEGDLERAFLFVEYAKARSFSESLHRSATDGKAQNQVAAQLRLRLRRFYRRLDYLEARPNAGSAGLLNEIRTRTAACERELAMAPAEPGGRELSGLDTGEITLAAIQAHLGVGEAFLQYFALRSSLVLLAIRKEEIRCFDLGPLDAVDAAYRLMRFQLARGGLPWADALEDSTWLPASQRHLEALYRLLIEPARHWLPEGHWTIAPHRDLHRVPFHALRHAGRYLIDERTISYAPSAGVWLRCLLRTAPPLENAAVFGVPDGRCPAIAEEASVVASLLPGAALYQGSQATMEQLASCGNSAVIHIASHGLYRADNPAFSSIQLANNRLTLFDLRHLELNAELVTLSGCATGVHESAGADEILGLTRGVLLAGARAAHVSLWAINDESTAEYMTGFYSCLAAGMAIPEALRQSMTDLRDQYPHPFFWAPFALTGGISAKKNLRSLYQTQGAPPLY